MLFVIRRCCVEAQLPTFSSSRSHDNKKDNCNYPVAVICCSNPLTFVQHILLWSYSCNLPSNRALPPLNMSLTNQHKYLRRYVVTNPARQARRPQLTTKAKTHVAMQNLER